MRKQHLDVLMDITTSDGATSSTVFFRYQKEELALGEKGEREQRSRTTTAEPERGVFLPRASATAAPWLHPSLLHKVMAAPAS